MFYAIMPLKKERVLPMENDYMPRLFDGILDFSLKTKGAVVVTGPKWCGKSRTTKRVAEPVFGIFYEN